MMIDSIECVADAGIIIIIIICIKFCYSDLWQGQLVYKWEDSSNCPAKVAMECQYCLLPSQITLKCIISNTFYISILSRSIIILHTCTCTCVWLQLQLQTTTHPMLWVLAAEQYKNNCMSHYSCMRVCTKCWEWPWNYIKCLGMYLHAVTAWYNIIQSPQI